MESIPKPENDSRGFPLRNTTERAIIARKLQYEFANKIDLFYRSLHKYCRADHQGSNYGEILVRASIHCSDL